MYFKLNGRLVKMEPKFIVLVTIQNKIAQHLYSLKYRNPFGTINKHAIQILNTNSSYNLYSKQYNCYSKPITLNTFLFRSNDKTIPIFA